MKKIIITLLLVVSIFTISACNKKEEQKEIEITPALKFKEDYEKFNGQTNASGKEHRTVSISATNPFIEVTPEEIVEKIENNETFYVYFGSSLCPWCRSVIERAIENAKQKNISTIYYVDIWDEEGNEILRDKFELEKNIPRIVQNGTTAYYKLLDAFKDSLEDYTLTNDKGKKISVGEKRIYAPTFIYVKEGKLEKITDGTSSLQTDSRQELTQEILNDEDKLFTEFFNN